MSVTSVLCRAQWCSSAVQIPELRWCGQDSSIPIPTCWIIQQTWWWHLLPSQPYSCRIQRNGRSLRRPLATAHATHSYEERHYGRGMYV